MKNWILIMLCLAFASCKKDTTEEVTPDTRKVRILKVEQTDRTNTFPFTNLTFATVEYHYGEDDHLSEIVFYKDARTQLTFQVQQDSNGIHIQLPNDKSLRSPFFKNDYFYAQLRDFDIELQNDRVVQSSNNISTFIDVSPSSQQRKVYYNYDNNGRLLSERASLVGDGVTIPDFRKDTTMETSATYEGNLLKSYRVIGRSSISNNYDLQKDITTTFEYQKAYDVPDELVQFVNQALSGISNLGFEQYLFQWGYDMATTNHLGTLNTFLTDILRPNYVFADWIISFGLPKPYFTVSTDNYMIASKKIQGRLLTDIDLNTGTLVYSQVDSTVQYPYTLNITKQTKELYVGGLKITYEIVGN